MKSLILKSLNKTSQLWDEKAIFHEVVDRNQSIKLHYLRPSSDQRTVTTFFLIRIPLHKDQNTTFT